MADKIKIDSEKLEAYDKLIRQVWNTIEKATTLFNEMKTREKVLAGGVILQVDSPWNESKISAMLGNIELTSILVNRAANEIRKLRNTPPPMPPVFKDPDKNIN